MADYENLLDSIDAVIRSNNRREITGQILQNTLHQMVGSLGENYQLAGFATPTLDPNSPDQNVFYITDEAGVYTNFDNITLGAGLSFLMWKNEEWTSKTLDVVTADWLDEHYVSKAFLRKVFQFFDEDGVEIFPNDTESVVDNIKAMCGLWTNEYLSALGLGEGSTIPTTLAALNDVTITNPQDGQALVYDAASLHWVNATIQSGVDMSVVWAALAGSTNEQINISHLTTALSDYVTATSLATTLQSYVTTSALATELANYASQNWVETNYVSKAFFNSLFEAQDVNGNAITPNNSGQTTIDRLKILVGAYTEQYLSALGLSSGGGGGGSSTLAGLNDVTITNPQDGQALIYDAQSSHWVNGAAISMSAVWTALAAATSEQINSSHLTSALSGYVTTSALASELANYVTTSGLATTLADYVTTSALATTLADYGSKTWVESNYISKAFFNRLFQAFAPLAEGQTEPTQVEPNDTTTTIDNIKAMFGLWTEQYLSALGLSAGGGHTIGVLNDLNDVTITNPQNDQVLKYNNGIWVNAAAPSGATALSGLTDVAISSLADKDLLQWDYASGKWKNVVLSTVMSAYALASAIPTNVSQLNNDSGYITSAALSGYALTSQIPTNNNQLTNGAGYITGITSSMVTTALGYTPANSASLSNYVNNQSGRIYSVASANVLNLDNTDGGEVGIRLLRNGTVRGWLGYMDGGYMYMYNSQRGNYLKYNDNGTLTFEDYTVIHSGNVSSYAVTSLAGYATTSWVSSNYLPLSGGKLTDALIIRTTAYNNFDEGIRIQDAANHWAGITFGATGTTGCKPESGQVAWFAAKTSVGKFIISPNGSGDTTGLTLNYDGDMKWREHTVYHSGNLSPLTTSNYSSYALPLSGGTCTGCIKSTFYGPAFEADATPWCYMSYRSGNYNWHIGTCNGGDTYIGDAGAFEIRSVGNNYSGISIRYSSSAYGRLVVTTTSGECSIGLKSGSSMRWTIGYTGSGSEFGWFYSVGGGWKLTLDGNGNLVAQGGVTALSDIRHKTIVSDTRLQVSDIAKMRAVRYLWDDGREDKGMHVGSIAQDWQQILPEVVLRANNDEGTLSLQYGVAALISSITIARKVVNHEERIKALERENADLKQAYSFIKNAYDYLKMDYEQLKLKIA